MSPKIHSGACSYSQLSMMKNILITGGLGYVGGRITEWLAANGSHRLYITTRKTNPVIEGPLAGHPRIHFLQTDEIFRDEEAFDRPFDSIIHLAALNEIDCAKFPAKAVDVNVTRSVLILQKAIRSNTPQFIYFSTAHIYGPLAGHIDELHFPRPVHPYAITHRAMEDFVYAAHRSKKIKGISLRLSNSLGAPVIPDVDRWTLLVNDLCRQVAETGRLTLLSSGVQQRDFIALEDVARCVGFFLDEEPADLQDGIFNLGGNCTMSVLEMTKLIQERASVVLGFTPSIQLPEKTGPAETASGLQFNSGKLTAAGFRWKNNIEGEIDDLLRFCKKHFGQ